MSTAAAINPDDAYRIAAALYAREAHAIAASITAARRQIAEAQPYVAWQVTPAALALHRADRALQDAARTLAGAIDPRDPEHAAATRAAGNRP